MGVVSTPAGARRHGARDEAERQAAASRPLPIRLRQGAAVRGRSGRLPLAAVECVARAYYDQQRARGHAHRHALRALGAKWLKIIFVMWQRQVPYDEQYHLATMTRQQLRQRQERIA